MENWSKFEQAIARAIDGKRVPGSGNGNRKGDVTSRHFLVECKETGQPALRVSLAWFDKIWNEARQVQKIPLFACEFNNKEQFVLAPLDMLPEDLIAEFSNEISVTLTGRVVTWDNTFLFPGLIVPIGARRWLVLSLHNLQEWRQYLEDHNVERG